MSKDVKFQFTLDSATVVRDEQGVVIGSRIEPKCYYLALINPDFDASDNSQYVVLSSRDMFHLRNLLSNVQNMADWPDSEPKTK